jgi:hypothetical protein
MRAEKWLNSREQLYILVKHPLRTVTELVLTARALLAMP